MIDLHIHTKYSDGTDTIEEVIDKIIDMKINYFSITDHDTIDGVCYLLNNKELLEKLDNNDIKFVSGIEFSGILDGDKIHLLGYNYDPNNENILNAVDVGKQKRLSKFQIRIDALKEQLGIVYSQSSLDEMKKEMFLGKPIMAHYLVKDGLFKTKEEAINNAINKLKVKAQETRVDAEIIVPAIVKSGGICVWAHPLGGIGEPRISFDKVEEIITKLLPLGLKGLECYYNLYTLEENRKLLDIAEKYGLLISAGSDYHGKNKKAEIGEVLDLQYYDATNEVNIINELF